MRPPFPSPFLFLLLSFLQLLQPPPWCHGADLPGHMQPLGSHRPPEAVTRLSHVPSAEEFHENWEKAGQPVVLEGLLKGTEVLGNWQQDDYLRFSSGGARSVLHSDSYQNLHCVVSGQKEFVLIEPKYTETIGPELQEIGYYPIDVDSVNMTARPGLAEVPWHKATVNEGDCLYLPYEWLHQVRSHDRNFGVYVWWMPFKVNMEECSPSHAIPDFAPIGDFQVLEELQIKYVLKDLASDDGTVHVEDLYRVMNENASVPWVTLQNVREVFEILDPGCGDILHSKKIDSTPYETYKKAHNYIMDIHVGEERVGDPDEEFQPFDPDYFYFDGDLDEAGDYDFEDPEHITEGGRHSRIPSQPRRDEL